MRTFAFIRVDSRLKSPRETSRATNQRSAISFLLSNVVPRSGTTNLGSRRTWNTGSELLANGSLESFLVPEAEAEKRTGLKFFPNLSCPSGTGRTEAVIP